VTLAQTEGILLPSGNYWEVPTPYSDRGVIIQNGGQSLIRVQHVGFYGFKVSAYTEGMEAEIDSLKTENARLRSFIEHLTEPE
jgi:hypothetical protein